MEATMMGPALVGRTQAGFEERRDRAAAKRGITGQELEDRYSTNGYLVGTPDRVSQSVKALEEVGVQRLYVQWLDLDDPDGMKETMEIVRQIKGLLPMILISADQDDNLLRKALSAHAFCVLAKPVSRNVVIYIVNRAFKKFYVTGEPGVEA